MVQIVDSLGLQISFFLPGGRLTASSGIPITNGDITGVGTIFFTPYIHDMIAIYNGASWSKYHCPEISLSLSGIVSGSNYDVFIKDVSGTLTLSLSAAWTSDSARADALGTQDGVVVLDSDHTKLYLGTIRATGSGVFTDAAAIRFMWNMYNKVPRGLYKTDGTSHTYNSGTIRYWNNDPTNIAQFIVGQVYQNLFFDIYGSIQGSSDGGITGADLDSAVTYIISVFLYNGSGSIDVLQASSSTSIDLTQGYHFIAAVEQAAGGAGMTFNAYTISGTIWG